MLNNCKNKIQCYLLIIIKIKKKTFILKYFIIIGVAVAIHIPIIVELEQMFKVTILIVVEKKIANNGLWEKILALVPLMHMVP